MIARFICRLAGHRWAPVTIRLNYDPPIDTGDRICSRCWAVSLR